MNDIKKLIDFLDTVMEKGSFLFSEEAKAQDEETYKEAIDDLVYEEMLKMPKVQNRKQDGITFYLLGEPDAPASQAELHHFNSVLQTVFKLHPETRHPYIVFHHALDIVKNTSDDEIEVKRLYGQIEDRERDIEDQNVKVRSLYKTIENKNNKLFNLEQKTFDLEAENATLKSTQVIYQLGTGVNTGSFFVDNNTSNISTTFPTFMTSGVVW